MDNGLELQISEHDITPGERPHLPHRHATDQALLVIDGTFEVTTAGEKTRLGPGSMAYQRGNYSGALFFRYSRRKPSLFEKRRKEGEIEMRRLFLSVLCAVLLLGLASERTASGSGADTDEQIKDEILKMERSKVEALKAGGEVAAKWFEDYYTDDIDYISGNGHVFTKNDTVNEFRSGVRKLRVVIHDDYRVRVYGNTAVLTYRGNDIMDRNGKPGKQELVRTTDVYVKQPDGVWRIAVHHVTPVHTQ